MDFLLSLLSEGELRSEREMFGLHPMLPIAPQNITNVSAMFVELLKA
jgi:hypothetical protein